VTHVVVGEMICAMDIGHSGQCIPLPMQASDQEKNVTYQPKPGDIGITMISDWGGLAIRTAQWLNGCGFAKYTHAYVVTEVSADGTVWIVEAMPQGARRIENWHKDVVYLRCPEQYREHVADAAIQFAINKTPYSDLDYLAQAAHRFHLPAPHLKNYIESSGHLICSQLADKAAERGGWHLFADGRWPGYVPPCDLYKLYVTQRVERYAQGDVSR
jgi:hypothetical protein